MFPLPSQPPSPFPMKTLTGSKRSIMNSYLSDAEEVHEHGHLFRECPLTQAKKDASNSPNSDLEGFIVVNKSKKSTTKPHQKSDTKVPESSNPFSPLENLAPPRVHPTAPPPVTSSLTPKRTHLALEIQSKKQKRNPSVLLLDYPQQISNTPMHIEESNSEEAEFSLEGINLQAIITACNSQRPETIPPDQLQKIEWALRSEFSCPSLPVASPHHQGILTTTNHGNLTIQKDSKQRGRRTNMEALKQAGALLINSGQIRLIEGFFPSNPTPHQ